MSLFVDNNNFSPMKFESPISDKKPEGPKVLSNLKIKRKLDFNKIETEENQLSKQPALDQIQRPATLSELYGPFFDLPPNVADHRFAEIVENYQAIETQLKEFPNPEFTSKASEIRSYLKFLLNIQKDHDLLMAEIGILRFYLDSKIDKLAEISLNESDPNQFLKYRSHQIKGELDLLEADYQKFIDDPKASFAPSGKKYYLMRALVHMVILSNGDYNKGGLIAIRLMVEDVNYPTAQEFDAEHALQVRNVATQIQKHSGFNALFKQPIQIHPSLQDLIRSDLMLKRFEKVKPPHVHLALLLALFRPNFQNDLSNCYAVAPWNFLVACYPFHVYSKLMDWLQKGYLSFKEANFPVEHLLANRLNASAHQLAAQIKVENNQEPTLFAFLRSRFESSTYVFLPNQTYTASVHLADLSGPVCDGQGFTSETLYLTFFESLLTNIGISAIEFTFENSEKIDTGYRAGVKSQLISICVDYLLPGANLDNTFTKKYREKLISKLYQLIWLDNICRPKLSYKNNTFPVKFNHYVISSFPGEKVTPLIGLLERSMGVFSTINNNYTQITSIEELKKLCSEINIQVAAEISQSKDLAEVLAFDRIKQSALKRAKQKALTTLIAKFISDQVKLKGISPKAIKNADLLLFLQGGGYEDRVIKEIFALDLESRSASPMKSTRQLLEKILTLIQGMGEETLRKTPKLLLSIGGYHAWTLDTHLWISLTEKIKDRKAFWKNYFEDPVQKKLMQSKPGEKITWGEWRAKNMNPTTTSSAKAKKNQTLMDEELNKVQVSASDLKMIFSNFKLLFSEAKIDEIINSLKSKKRYPHVIAKTLRGFCLAERNSSPCVYALELAICEQMGLPINFYLGDMNWGDNKENSLHTELVIRWNWWNGDYEFATRQGKKVIAESISLNEKFSIYLPK